MSLLFFTTTCFGLERPIVLKTESTDFSSLAKEIEAIWIPGGSPGDVIEIDSSTRSARSVLSKQIPRLAPCRVKIQNRWSFIFPVLTISTNTKVTTTDGLKELDLRYDDLSSDLAVGTVPEGKAVRIRLPLLQSQKIRVETIANQLGSQLDPLVRMLGEKGNEFPHTAGNLLGGRDTAKRFRATDGGSYVLEIRDIANGGGSDYFFCLSVGPFPEASDYFGILPYNATWPDLNSYPRLPEQSVPNPTRIQLEQQGRGHFYKRKQIDLYEFEVGANEQVIISADTRRFGSPCDVRLALLDQSGKQIAESVGDGPNGPSITNRFEKAGTYHAKINEIASVHGIGATYWLSLKQARPGVTLTTEIERADLSKEGEAKLKIAAKRYDYEGPIKFRIEGLPEGVEIVDPVFPEKKNEFELKLKRTKEVPAFQIRIYGEIETKEEFPVSTMPALRKLYPLQLFPCAAMDGWIAVNPPN